MASVKDALLRLNNLANEMIVNQLLQLENSFQQTVDQIAAAAAEQAQLNERIAQGEKKASKLG
ncbi:hypothetical protein GNF98_15030, partial [Clostridium perfringens]